MSFSYDKPDASGRSAVIGANVVATSQPLEVQAGIDALRQGTRWMRPEQQRIADIHHHCEADHLGRTVETKVWIACRRRPRTLTIRLKPIGSDDAHRSISNKSSVSL